MSLKVHLVIYLIIIPLVGLLAGLVIGFLLPLFGLDLYKNQGLVFIIGAIFLFAIYATIKVSKRSNENG